MGIQKLEKWQFKGCWKNEPYMYSYGDYDKVRGVTFWMDASVPGSVHHDLMTNGVIPDPYYDDNSLACEWVEGRWWVYKTTFTVDSDEPDVDLVFTGLDYEAQIVLNGRLIGRHKGMFMDCRIPVSEVVDRKGPNTLIVVLEGIPDEIGMYGFTSTTHTQKSRFGYKWDFAPRLVHIGIYDPVYIHTYDGCRLDGMKLTPVKEGDQWSVEVEAELLATREMTATVAFELDGKRYEKQVALTPGVTTVEERLPVEKPRLWWPSGHGEQHLYPLTATVGAEGTVSDEKTYRVGLRTLEYRHTSNADPAKHFPYQAVINGKAIYLKGVNFVPLDLMYGAVMPERYREMLLKAKRANINTIRVWGGGFIERESFYDLCDELGIMIWQDFVQSSAAIEDIPAKDEEFLRLLERVATFAVKQKRNHVSLTYWCGGNELTDEKYVDEPVREVRNNHPATFEDQNLAMLRDIVDRYDGMRLMLPTSASGDTEWLVLGTKGVNQDIHGPWKYGGAEDHYRLFNESDSMLHSEFGSDGMSSLESLMRYLSPAHVRLTSSEEDLVWEHHTCGWETYASRERLLFGDFSQDEFGLFIDCSQYMQGESIRYSVEANRRRQGENCGSMVWQFNEPWPNACCTNLVEYTGREKMAYYFLAEGYRTRMASLRYDKLLFKAKEIFCGEVFIHNEGTDAAYTVEAEIRDDLGNVLLSQQLSGDCGANKAVYAGTLSLRLPSSPRKGFTVKLKSVIGGEKTVSEYLLFIADPATGKADRYYAGAYARQRMAGFREAFTAK